jgi:RNA polymerase sigma-70 factor (ECF subfamily)
MESLVLSRKVGGRTSCDPALDSAIAKARDKLVAWQSRTHDRADAEDFAHDAICKVLSKPTLYEARRGKLETWLFRVAKNVAIDEMRRRKRAGLVELDALTEDVAPWFDGPAETYEHRAQRTRLYKALRRLPREQRFPVILHCMLGYSYPVIATRLHVKPEQARYQVKKGLAALQTVLRE